MKIFKSQIILFLIPVFIVSCATQRLVEVDKQTLISAKTEISEDQLLDIGIVIFDPGLDQNNSETELVMPEVRKAEARFIPVHLRNTLQQSGQWGAVRVIPAAAESMDLIINGKILQSDGEVLSLNIIGRDATGKVWLNKGYKGELSDKQIFPESIRGKKDAFQNVYNAIANDLVMLRRQQSARQIENIQQVAILQFSEKLVPEAFRSYVVKDEQQLLKAVRMPVVDDPMFVRVQRIQARDAMLIDTLDGYYDYYYSEMWESYNAWRANHREEVIAYRELKKSALKRYLLGAAAVSGAIALAFAGVDGSALLQGLMVAGGGYAIKSGIDKSEEAQINADAIKELDQSFEAEMAPHVFAIDGKTVELSGSAQAQYQTWQHMLGKLYALEIEIESGQLINESAVTVAPQ